MPVESKYPRIEISQDDVWKFLFERKDREFPDDKVVFTESTNGRSYTYKQLKDATISFGKGLKSLLEWKKGDVLCVFSSNCVDTPAVVFGTLWAAGIVTTANSGYTVDELEFQLKDSGAKAIVTRYEMLPIASEAAERAGIPTSNILILGDTRDTTRKYKHFTSIVEISGTSKWRRSKINTETDLAFLVYSSGTTGKPKGVKLSHRNIVANIMQITDIEGKVYTWKRDVVMGCLPFFHIYGLTLLVQTALYLGLRVIVMPKFELPAFCSLIQEYKITTAYIVPPIVLGLGKHPIVSNYDLSSLQYVMSGAAPLTKDLVETFYNRLKCPIKQGYGLSETSPVTHMTLWDDWRKVGATGKLVGNMTAKYVDAEEKEVPVGKEGELWLKGPNVFLGYLNNDAATKNSFSEDGYFKTGDIGYEDADGNLYITDRLKELIKYKGFQVPPAELEGVLLGNEKVADVCVIGVFNEEQATEVPRAYIVPSAGVKGDAALAKELSDWLAERMAPHKRLRGGVRFVDEIPKSAAGKILRRLIRDRAREEDAPKAKL